MLVAMVLVWLALAKSQGELDRTVRVSADLTNVGDGLPEKSDVKFRGVLVGQVSTVDLGGGDRPNVVHIDLSPEYAATIPGDVTARVVPSNVFAVSSVQLVDGSSDRAFLPLREGAVIAEDTSLPTVLFQSTLTKFRQVLNAVSIGHTDTKVGVLAALSEATHGRGEALRNAGSDLKKIVEQLNTLVGADAGPSTLSALSDAVAALKDSSPDLYDALDTAISPLRTFNETEPEFTALLAGGAHTTGTLADAFDNQTDRMIAITTQLTPVVGVLADNAGQFQPIFGRLQRLADRMNFAFDRTTNNFTLKGVLSLTPFRQYVRADCPRYGALEGPSCQTAPEIPSAPSLYPSLSSMGVTPPPGLSENRADLAPPRDSTRHAGEVPGGPAQDGPPEPPLTGPARDEPPLVPGEAPPRAAPSANRGDAAHTQAIGGNVGPVGSRAEAAQLSEIIRRPADAATQLLLGPVVRGTTVHMTDEAGTQP